MAKKKQVIEAVGVTFDEDNVSALYLDGKLAMTNNDYDGSRLLAFDNFVAGVEWCGKSVKPIEWLYVSSEDGDEGFPTNDDSNIPKVWPDGKWSERAG